VTGAEFLASLPDEQLCSPHGVVYFARAKRSGNIKIGWTSGNPRHRIKQWQTGTYEPVELLAVVEGGQDVERAYHTVFRGLHLHGEWFRGGCLLLATIGELDEAYRIYWDSWQRAPADQSEDGPQFEPAAA
jgi:hypothetical protein